MSTFSCDTTFVITKDQLEAWQSLNAAHALVVAQVDHTLAAAGLPPRTWYEALAALRDAPEEPLRMGEFAKAVGLSPGGATKLIDRLVAAGLVERVACPTDRRASHVALLPAGEEMLVKMWPAYAAALETAFVAPLDGDVDGAAGLSRLADAVSCPPDVSRSGSA